MDSRRRANLQQRGGVVLAKNKRRAPVRGRGYATVARRFEGERDRSLQSALPAGAVLASSRNGPFLQLGRLKGPADQLSAFCWAVSEAAA
jgi:hypothetical protein